MAHIDNLIESIADPALRAALQTEVRKLFNNRQFGLVFNPHKPESVLLPKFTVRRGDKVRVLNEGTSDRTDVDDSGVWTLLKFTGDIARLRSKFDPNEFIEVDRDRLVVVQEFGDPIYPGLRYSGSVERGGNKPWHAVIKGENYHALQALLYSSEGKVDAIYIDPPYNTGARDWKYNNDYVDDNDPYRHSKWLSFMEKRLRLAKRLLNPSNSVLIVTIDEKEVNRLGLLIQQVFPGVKTQMISSVISPGGVSREREFTRVNEFLFFVMVGDARPIKTPSDMLFSAYRTAEENRSTIWRGLLRGGTGPLRGDSESKLRVIHDD